VRQFVDDILGPVNSGTLTPNSTMRLGEFVDKVWFPYIAERVRPYTTTVYRQLWLRHLRDRIGLSNGVHDSQSRKCVSKGNQFIKFCRILK
jgi:hypothetical protein